MIELSTGVVFLMSSLYGSGQANAQIATAAAAMNTNGNSASTSETVTLKTTNSNDTANSSNPVIADNLSFEAYVRKEFADTPIMIDIIRCESHFHQYNSDGSVLRGIANKQDVGLMQINEKYHAETAKNLGLDIYTTEGNAAFGKYLYKKYGTSPWNYSSKCWAGTDLAKK